MSQHTLPRLGAGDRGTIDRIARLSGSAKQLADMGFVRGARIEMIRPGRPCIVQIDGTRVGLGRLFQDNILLVENS